MSKPEKKATDKVAKPDSKRRNFLIGAGLGGVGAAAALAGGVAGVTAETKTEKEPVAEAGAKGYQETEHVRRYYGTTRI